MPTLNFLIAIIIGFIIGFVLELVIEVLYFRGWRRQVRDDRITQLAAELAASDEQLTHARRGVEARDAKIADLEGRLARGQERLNTLQRDAALQRQRAQVAAEVDHTSPEVEDSPAPGVDDRVIQPSESDAGTESDSEIADTDSAVAWAATEGGSHSETGLD